MKTPSSSANWADSIVLFLIAAFMINACATCFAQEAENEKRLLKNTRQLIFEGKRSGEGYFSSDGKSMVFQSERDPANPFFQIYLLDFEFGDVTSISPGDGKTTCAWVHPNKELVLFSSTHDDPQAKSKQRAEIEFRESGQTRRYSWDYDENYEMYSFDPSTKKYQRLTNVVGYDAEGSYSPDGKLIAFASNRNAYSEEMSDEDKELFELDPAYMMEIYIMNADGTGLKQLTDVKGYDGGPFFSPDGKRICWRRFAPNGATAEVMTMNIDGSDQKQITRFNKMSWAPYYHPSGKYLIFTTNEHGFANFELYLADTDGKSTPVRVTNTKGFDGLASFSPDGTKLTWTTNRNEKKQSQIFLADWDHELALKLLGIDQAISEEEATAGSLGNQTASQTSTGFNAEDVGRHVDFLCRRELGGRMTGSIGEKQATAYVAAYMDSLGIVPDGDDGTWFQSFDFPAGAELGKTNQLEFAGNKYKTGTDWTPITFSGSGTFDAAQVVFAGYGIDAPESDDQPAYNSYEGIDVAGKWVLMFRYLPDEVEAKRRNFLADHSQLRKKTMVARDKGAAGIIVVSGPKSNVKNQLVPLSSDFSSAGTSTGAISITDSVAEKWLSAAGKDLTELQTQLDTGKLITGFALSSEIKVAVDVVQNRGTGRNVVGRLVAADTPSAEAILIGAHIDHLGKGTSGSLAKSDEKGQIHVGADDNASGVAALLEVAEFLAAMKRQGKLNMKRDIVFAGWSGEELGLFGSKHYVKKTIGDRSKTSPLVAYSGDPHDLNALGKYYENFISQFDASDFIEADFQLLQSNIGDMKIVVKLLSSAAANQNGRNDETIENYSGIIERAEALTAETKKKNSVEPNKAGQGKPVVACLNMDMVGRMDDKVALQGLGSSNDWNRIIEKSNAVVGLPVEPVDDTKLPTDASSFYQAGIPILSAFTGSHNDYHTPRDTPEKLNYPDAARIARLMGLIARQLVISDEVPDYVRTVEKESKRVASAGRRARLGTVPNYTEKVAGVLLDDVEPGGPADQAGLKGGDIIIKLAGKKIENIYDYQYAIDVLKVGNESGVSIIRDEKRIDLKIVPGSRD